ncbi:MAG TPA: 16S rRNA (cytosine(1402)-N(4))-methyltransferase RsmH [Geobacteraceae bacterium]|nr:16S rRNA (cytosine(1402)-N(4))-methyltransferase RsmH [Geobacteraceae bacterium]
MSFRHQSVMPDEVILFLAPKPGGIYVDGTVGGAGHALRILEASSPDGKLIGFDLDEDALKASEERLSPFGERARLVHGNFDSITEILERFNIQQIDGLLLDLGVSSHQLDKGERGFSFREDAPLDMRMDRSSGVTAAELVNTLPEKELTRIILDYGEERWAKRIAAFIVAARVKAPIGTTMELVNIIKGAVPRGAWGEKLHPATRTFQGLRIAVNNELTSLEKGLEMGIALLKKGGRAVVISFHSLEDRIAKNTLRSLSRGCVCPRDFPRCVCGKKPVVKVLTGTPVRPGATELETNPRARSARLRAAEKL